ncbi:hypothetical protein [Sinomonas halotolerans]|uniref:DUF5709 domain-containing protein n=1 Tax=Sinomonas halotolerans TaxID=1644133 RepID=A0ABU9WVV2_9MICC
MAAIDDDGQARREEDPSEDFVVEPDVPVWDEEDGLIDSEDIVVEADPADLAEQHRSAEE